MYKFYNRLNCTNSTNRLWQKSLTTMALDDKEQELYCCINALVKQVVINQEKCLLMILGSK